MASGRPYSASPSARRKNSTGGATPRKCAVGRHGGRMLAERITVEVFTIPVSDTFCVRLGARHRFQHETATIT